MAKVTIHDALEYCLANPDGLGVEELLARFPQYGEELEPLLTLSSRIEEVTPPPVPAERRAAMKARLMDAAAHGQATQVAPEVPTRPVVIPAEQKRSWIWTILRRPVLVASAMAALLVLGVWWGAASALPDSPFYNIKLASENFMLNFAGGDADKANAHLRLANARLDEIEAMNRQGKLEAAGGAISNYQEHIDSAATLRKQTAGEAEAGVKAGISTTITRLDQTLKSFGGDVAALPGPMKSNLAQLYGDLSDIRAQIGEPPLDVPESIDGIIVPGPTPEPTQGSRTPEVSPGVGTPAGGVSATSTRTAEVAAATGTSTPITGASMTVTPGGTTTTIEPTSTPSTGTARATSTATRKVSATPTRGGPVQPSNTTQPTRTSTPARTSTPTRTSIPGAPSRTPSAGPPLVPSRTATRTYTATYTATRTATHIIPTQIEPSPTRRPPSATPTSTTPPPPDPPEETPAATIGVPR